MYRHWTKKDIDDCRKGIIPEGRTYQNTYSFCKRIGIRFVVASRKNSWNDDEIRLVLAGKKVNGRSASACRTMRCRLSAKGFLASARNHSV